LGSVESGEILSAGRAADALIRNANTSWADVLNQRELLAENARLRATAYHLQVENSALRKSAARRLAHRILDGAKQYGQALLTRVTAVDGIEFLRRQLPARHHDGEPRSFRPVVVRSLVVAGILLTPGVVAFLSLHDVAMLAVPSVRSGTVASPRQEAPEAAARSDGLPTQAERRATNFGPPATIAKATPPTTSPMTSRPPAQSSPNQDPSAAETTALVTRGDDFLSAGDIVSARQFYERAADRGDGGAALRLGATFDPDFLGRTVVRGALGDPAQTSSWYRRAADLGNPAAQERLKNLEQQRVPEPGSLPH